MQVAGIYKPFCEVKARGMKLDRKIFSGNIDRHKEGDFCFTAGEALRLLD